MGHFRKYPKDRSSSRRTDHEEQICGSNQERTIRRNHQVQGAIGSHGILTTAGSKRQHHLTSRSTTWGSSKYHVILKINFSTHPPTLKYHVIRSKEPPPHPYLSRDTLKARGFLGAIFCISVPEKYKLINVRICELLNKMPTQSSTFTKASNGKHRDMRPRTHRQAVQALKHYQNIT